MGCYYLTAARGEEGETVEAGDGMIFHSPAELFRRLPASASSACTPRSGPACRSTRRSSREVKDEKGKPVVEELPRKPNGLVRTTVGRVIFNDILHPKMAFYDLPLGSQVPVSRIIADCYQILGRRETIDLLDRMKETGFRESTRSRACQLRRDRPPHAGQQGSGAQGQGQGSREAPQAVRARHHHRAGALQQGASTPGCEARDKITKKMMTELAERSRADATGKACRTSTRST